MATNQNRCYLQLYCSYSLCWASSRPFGASLLSIEYSTIDDIDVQFYLVEPGQTSCYLCNVIYVQQWEHFMKLRMPVLPFSMFRQYDHISSTACGSVCTCYTLHKKINDNTKKFKYFHNVNFSMPKNFFSKYF